MTLLADVGRRRGNTDNSASVEDVDQGLELVVTMRSRPARVTRAPRRRVRLAVPPRRHGPAGLRCHRQRRVVPPRQRAGLRRGTVVPAEHGLAAVSRRLRRRGAGAAGRRSSTRGTAAGTAPGWARPEISALWRRGFILRQLRQPRRRDPAWPARTRSARLGGPAGTPSRLAACAYSRIQRSNPSPPPTREGSQCSMSR